jgi:hypothetical protein
MRSSVIHPGRQVWDPDRGSADFLSLAAPDEDLALAFRSKKRHFGKGFRRPVKLPPQFSSRAGLW